MADNSAIEWTDATWNPTVGCSLVSPGCTNCYAMKVAHRLARMPEQRQHYDGMTQDSKGGPVWTGTVRLIEKALDRPLHWKRPRRIFVNSMSDLFHESLPDDAIDRVFSVMAGAPQHTFQVLTKRGQQMQGYLSRFRASPAWDGFITRDGIPSNDVKRPAPLFDPDRWPLPNVWLGVSVEDKARKERVNLLRTTPAAVRFLSLEPLLEDLGTLDLTGIDWVIVGGESGPGARPMHPDWARSLRDQCAAAGVPFFFKQWGEWFPGEVEDRQAFPDIDHDPSADRWEFGWARLERVAGEGMLRVGKKRAGRMLDGAEHNAFPEARK